MLRFLSWNETNFLYRDRLDALVPVLVRELGEYGVGAILGRVAGDLSTSQLVELLDASLDALQRKSQSYNLFDIFSALLATLARRGLTARVESAAQTAFWHSLDKRGWPSSVDLLPYVRRLTVQDLSGYMEHIISAEWSADYSDDNSSALASRAAAEIRNGTFTFPDFEHALVRVLAARIEQHPISEHCECLQALTIVRWLHRALGGATRASSALTRVLLEGFLKSMRDGCDLINRTTLSEMRAMRDALSVDARIENFLHDVWATYVILAPGFLAEQTRLPRKPGHDFVKILSSKLITTWGRQLHRATNVGYKAAMLTLVQKGWKVLE
ncbi:hypothetical protein HK405_008385 [Cladochytrium tenue]|nr:hypothetical protein HK405_008385 [Cladochytrium tenue]